MRCLAGLVKGDDDCQAHGHLRGGHRDDKEHEHLRVVILLSVNQTVSGEGNQGEIGGAKHHFQTHENDDDAAAQDDATQSDGEEKAACKEIIGECRHGGKEIGSYYLAETAVAQDDDADGGHEKEYADDFEGKAKVMKKIKANEFHIIRLRAGERGEGLGKGGVGNHETGQ